MIDNLTIQNIRVFKGDPRCFDLKKLTVFTGTNSSGKSTLLKILPLLRQTQGIRESAEAEDSKLRLKGGQVDLGHYRSLISDNITERSMGLGITFSKKVECGTIRWLRAMKAGTVQQFKMDNPSDSHLVDYSLDCMFQFTAEPEKKNTSRQTSPGTLKNATFSLIHKGEVLLKWTIARIETDDPARVEGLYTFTIPKSLPVALGMDRFFRPLNESEIDTRSYIVAVRGILPAVIVAESVSSKPEEENVKDGKGDLPWNKWPLPFPLGFDFTPRRSQLE